MKQIAIILFVFLFVGCAEEYTPNDYTARIKDWQEREALAPPIETTCIQTDSMFYILQSIAFELDVEYDYDKYDYFNSSDQSLGSFGDCEDFAIVVYRAVLDSCIGDQVETWIRTYDYGKEDHTVCIVQDGEDFYEIDYFVVIRQLTNDPIAVEFDMFNIF